MKRKIAAVMAADIAGYGQLVAEDAEETQRRLESYRAVFEDFVSRSSGRIVRAPGNEILAEFSSAVEAVRCAIDVQEAKSGDLLVAGRALICPGNRHMMVRRMPRGDMAVLSDGPAVNGHRPSADVLFHSVAQEFGLTAVGLIMTGMGEDGAEGLGAIRAAGGLTLAQSEDTCVVGGMPHAAIQKGHVIKVVSLDGLGAYLVSQFGGGRAHSEKADRTDKSEKMDKPEKQEKNERTSVSSHRT